MSYDREKLTELLSAYLDDELSPKEHAEVVKLLQENEEAQEIYAHLSSTASLFNSIGPVDPPPYLKQKIIRRISLQNRTSFMQRIKDHVSARKYNFPILTYASASVILIFFIVYPVTMMLEWPQDATQTALPFQAQNDLYDFAYDDDEALELYADAPEIQDMEEEFAFAEQPTPQATLSEKEMNSRGEAAPEAAPMESNNVIGERAKVQANPRKTELKEEEFAALPKDMNDEKIVGLAPGVQAEKMAGGIRTEDKVRGMAKKATPAPALETTSSISSKDNQYWVDVVDAYFDPSIQDPNVGNGIRKTVISGGRRTQFNIEAESGSDNNPIIYSSQFSPILPAMDFTFQDQLANDFIMILGEVHISSEGKVLYYRIECPAAARKLVTKYGAKLKETRVEPAVFNSRKVSVFYRFIATIYRNDNRAD